MSVTLEPFARHSFAFLEAARVYHDVWREADDGMYVDAVAMMTRHARYPGFKGLLARESASGRPVGMAYGHTSEAGQWWHDRVAPCLPPGHDGWLADCFVVVELAVMSEYRRRGIGRKLLAELTRDRREARAALSTQCDNLPARTLYESAGWEVLIEPVHFGEDAPAYVIYGIRLR